jgi:TetR/AcrR family transcriptional regulator
MPENCPICKIASSVRAKRERRKEARPGELLAAALDLFLEKGFAATRVEEVAQRAGVSKGTLFLYFSSKEELFKAVVRENISGRFIEWGEELKTFEGNSEELLRYCVTSWWERVGATKASALPKLMMSEAGNFPELTDFFQKEVVQPGNDLLQRILQRGVERGELRATDPVYGVYSLLAPMIFLNLWKHGRGSCGDARVQLDPQQYIASVVDTILYGLSTRQPAPSIQHPKNPT